MRDYAKVAPTFWTGDTGKAIRALGRDEQVVALYLLTCPSSNALGLYYLPVPTMCHETGCPIKGASKALRRVCEAGFASYDDRTEHVFVYRMAEYQIGQTLEANDKRVPWIKKELQAFKNTPFFNDFVERYKDAFHLSELEGLGRAFEAPSKPRAGAVTGTGDREGTRAVAGEHTPPTPSRRGRAVEPEAFAAFWSAYPKPTGKGKALEAWTKNVGDGDAEKIMSALEWQRASRDWTKDGGQFIPLPVTYLNQRRWEDRPQQHIGPAGMPLSELGEAGQRQAAIGKEWLADHERKEKALA